jgi:hypothetical protein
MPTGTAAAGVVHGELGDTPLGHLALNLRERRPDQLAMHRTVDRRSRKRFALTVGHALLGVHGRRFDSSRHVLRRNHRRRPVGGLNRASRPQGRRTGHGLLLPRRRNFRGSVVVFGIARHAAYLADVVLHHRDNRVIAHAPLARTVVIDQITNSKLALHHQKIPRKLGQERERQQDSRF